MFERHPSMAGFEGNTLGKYRLLAELGRGGMAQVYLAVSHGPAGFNKLVVLKQLSPALAEDPEFLAMFLDEARLAARLSHPNVVQTNEVGHDGSQYFIAMEYLEGQPLNRVLHRLGREGGLPIGMHLRILVDTLEGLHHAHELSDYDGTPLDVVHRDATPHNLFITYDGQVKVVDFGIAKALSSSAETRTGVLKGKVAYMSPEQARGEAVDRRADIFAIGVILWEALARRRLWKGLSDVAILHHIVTGQVASPRSVAPDVHPALESVCMRALAYRADERYPTAHEMARALDAAIEVSGETGTVREAGRLIAQYFDEERKRIRAIIEEQLGAVRSLSTSEYRAMSLPVLEQVGSHPSLSRDGSVGPSVTPSGPRPAVPGSEPASKQTTPLGLSSDRGTGSMSVRPPTSNRTVLAVVAVVAALGAAAALFMLTRSDGDAPTSAAPSPESTAVAAPSAAPKSIELSLRATPASAKLFIDDQPLPDNPHRQLVAIDDRPHVLRAEADGHVTSTREVHFDRDQAIELALEEAKPSKEAKTKRTVTGAAPPATATTAAPAPAETEDTFAKPPPKPKRTIDTSNPYGQ